MAMNVDQFCDKMIEKSPLTSNLVIPYHQNRGELLLLARQQLDKVGNLLGYLENPFSHNFF